MKVLTENDEVLKINQILPIRGRPPGLDSHEAVPQ